MPTSKMLPYYAARFNSVEINYTFYHMPTEKIIGGWLRESPLGFTFTLKAPQRITHNGRLRAETKENLDFFCKHADAMVPKLATLFFQLPPWARKDVPLLAAFLDMLPPGRRVAFEFRHASWLAEDVYSTLRAKNVALCVADSEKFHTPLVHTADYAYFRLRDEGYQERDIRKWADDIARATSTLKDVFVYFKHEEKGKGPEFASMLRGMLGA